VFAAAVCASPPYLIKAPGDETVGVQRARAESSNYREARKRTNDDGVPWQAKH